MPRTDTITYLNVTLSEIQVLTIARTEDDSPGMAVTVNYVVKDDEGNTGYGGSITLPLADQMEAEIRQWLTNRILPVINEQEGMS